MNLGQRVIEALIEQGYEVRLTSDFSGAIDFGRFRAARGQVKGFIFPDDLVILINKHLPLEERVVTLIHELLHELFPKWGEIKIEATTQTVYQKLSRGEHQVLEDYVVKSITSEV